MTEAEKERAAVEALRDHVEMIPAVLRLTPYKALTVALNGDGGWTIHYSRDHLKGTDDE